MIEKEISLIRSGKLVFKGHRYEDFESEKFAELFFSWMQYKESGTFVKQRANIPEGLTEGLVAKDIPNVFRKIEIVNNRDRQPSKFDCYNIDSDEIIEVKACSVPNDLTSWSPKPYFDKLYFVDFSSLDGSYKIYKIDINGEEIKEIKVSENETFGDQISNQRRPRFSIFDTFIRPRYKCSGVPVFEDDLKKHLKI